MGKNTDEVDREGREDNGGMLQSSYRTPWLEIGVLVTLFIIFVLFFFNANEQESNATRITPRHIVSRVDIGHLLSSSFITKTGTSPSGDAWTQLKTSKGTYYVKGEIAFQKGTKLVLDTYGSLKEICSAKGSSIMKCGDVYSP